MLHADARKMIEEGYYSDKLETEEILGLIAQWFPNVSWDLTLEEMVAEVCYGS